MCIFLRSHKRNETKHARGRRVRKNPRKPKGLGFLLELDPKETWALITPCCLAASPTSFIGHESSTHAFRLMSTDTECSAYAFFRACDMILPLNASMLPTPPAPDAPPPPPAAAAAPPPSIPSPSSSSPPFAPPLFPNPLISLEVRRSRVSYCCFHGVEGMNRSGERGVEQE